MSVFTKILEKLGLKKPATAPGTPSTPSGAKPPSGPMNPASPGTSAPSSSSGSKPPSGPMNPASPATSSPAHPAGPATVSGPAAPKPISEVDVVKELEQRAKGSGLDWKVSIVDLLKLLDIDSSRESRNELAQELGCPPEFMKDSAKMNTWLHKEVLRRIAQNGGNIPQNLLD